MKTKGVFQFTLIATVALALSSVPAAAQSGSEKDDMNDRFATEVFSPPASGFVVTTLNQFGSATIGKVKVKGLEPGHDYEIKVMIQLVECNFDPSCIDIVTSGTMTASASGNLSVANVGLGNLDAGLYRFDIFVTHNHPTVAGQGGVGQFLTALLDRDPLLACEPAPIVRVAPARELRR